METLENQIRSLIIESLNLEGMSPEEIADDTPLFGEEGPTSALYFDFSSLKPYA